jgi:hypothetical protein
VIRIASVVHGKDGYILRVEDVPAWAYAIDTVNKAIIGAVCEWSRGYLCPLCLCAKWDWTFKAGWGRDEDGLRRHNLGSLLFRLGQRGGRFCLKRARRRYERLLTFEEVCEHFPDSRSDDDDDGVDYVHGVLMSPAP